MEKTSLIHRNGLYNWVFNEEPNSVKNNTGQSVIGFGPGISIPIVWGEKDIGSMMVDYDTFHYTAKIWHHTVEHTYVHQKPCWEGSWHKLSYEEGKDLFFGILGDTY